jgi:hypothetical protein
MPLLIVRLNDVQIWPFDGFHYTPNETVEKPILGRAFPIRGLAKRPIFRFAGSLRAFLLRQGSVDRPISVDLADIV